MLKGGHGRRFSFSPAHKGGEIVAKEWKEVLEESREGRYVRVLVRLEFEALSVHPHWTEAPASDLMTTDHLDVIHACEVAECFPSIVSFSVRT